MDVLIDGFLIIYPYRRVSIGGVDDEDRRVRHATQRRIIASCERIAKVCGGDTNAPINDNTDERGVNGDGVLRVIIL